MKGYYGEEEESWPEGKFISVTRQVGGVAREKEGRRKIKKMGNVYTATSWKIEKQEVRVKFENFSFHARHCPSFLRSESVLPLDYGRN